MNNVIEFPTKIFRQWGPNAQALTTYLSCLGATTGEAGAIVNRLQLEWERTGLPLTGQAPQQIAKPGSNKLKYANNDGIKFHVREMPRHVGSKTARNLFELARLEYERAKVR